MPRIYRRFNKEFKMQIVVARTAIMTKLSIAMWNAFAEENASRSAGKLLDR